MDGRRNFDYSAEQIEKLIIKLNTDPATFLSELRQYPNINSSKITLSHKEFLERIIQILNLQSAEQRNVKSQFYCCLAVLTNNINDLDKSELEQVAKTLESKYPHAADSLRVIKLTLELAPYGTLNLPQNCYHNLAKAKLSNGTIQNMDLPYICLENAEAEESKFYQLKLRNGNLRHLNGKNSTWQEIDVAGAELHGINLEGKNTRLIDVSFFTDEEMQDKTRFKEALDRWHDMFTKDHPSGDHWYHAVTLKQHPQLNRIREAMVADINIKINELASAQQQVDAYNIAYDHPMFARHRDLTAIRGFFNLFTVFKAKDGSKHAESVIPTTSQKGLTLGSNPGPGQ